MQHAQRVQGRCIRRAGHRESFITLIGFNRAARPRTVEAIGRAGIVTGFRETFLNKFKRGVLGNSRHINNGRA